MDGVDCLSDMFFVVHFYFGSCFIYAVYANCAEKPTKEPSARPESPLDHHVGMRDFEQIVGFPSSCSCYTISGALKGATVATVQGHSSGGLSWLSYGGHGTKFSDREIS